MYEIWENHFSENKINKTVLMKWYIHDWEVVSKELKKKIIIQLWLCKHRSKFPLENIPILMLYI